jgi:hypothetical protein
MKDNSWGAGRTGKLIAHHRNYTRGELHSWEHETDVGVDSGCMRIGIYPPKEDEYDHVFEMHDNGGQPYEVKNSFAISSTGYGDGIYPVEVIRNKINEVIAIRINFEDEEDM